jgi:gluconolactonase
MRRAKYFLVAMVMCGALTTTQTNAQSPADEKPAPGEAAGQDDSSMQDGPAAGSADPEDTPVPPTVAERAVITQVYGDDAFFEGPVWDPTTGKLYFTAFVGSRAQILRLDRVGRAAVWLDKSEGANGMFLANNGRMLAAQAFGHRLMSYSIGAQGPTDSAVLAADKMWHQPNDVCQAPNGNIYFTDPDFRDRKTSAVFLLKPDGGLQKVITNMPLPNGVITSLDGKTLYVSDSHESSWRSYAIADDGKVNEGKVFFDPNTESRREPDGMTIDSDGNLYFTGRGGVWVVSPDGKSLGLIPTTEFATNATFGGVDGKTLYITCDKRVYSLQMRLPGGAFKKQEK